jgi:hypothetical protein
VAPSKINPWRVDRTGSLPNVPSKDLAIGPRARPTDALGVPRTVIPLTPVVA